MNTSKGHKTKYRPRNPDKYVDQRGIDNIVCRSSWERSVCIWADNNDDIVSWGSEVNVIKYLSKVDGKVHRYYIDFYLKFKNGSVYLVEVKPKHQTIAPNTENKTKKKLLAETITYAVNMSKWEAATRFAEKNNAKFVVWTEVELNSMGIQTNQSKAFKAISYKGKRPAKIQPMKQPKYKKKIGPMRKFDANSK